MRRRQRNGGGRKILRRLNLHFLAAIAGAGLLSATGLVSGQSLKVDDRVHSDRAAGLAIAGNTEGALQTASRIARPDRRERTFARVAIILTRAGKDKAARVMLSRIDDAGRRDDAAADVGIILARRAKLAEADKLAASLNSRRRDQIRAVMAAVLAEKGRIRDGRAMARRASDLQRRRQSLVAYRGGLARSMSASEAVGVARSAETAVDRVLSMLAVVRRLMLDGKISEALPALSWVRQQAPKTTAGTALRQRAAADTAMILLQAGDLQGAREAAADVADQGLRQFLLRQIDETRQVLP